MTDAVTFTPVDPELLRAVGADRLDLVDPACAVYPNRDLDLADIRMVGFDMDYTLAIYAKEPMEQLQYDLTIERLIARGYPDEIRALRYDPAFIVRGLVLDKRTGHLIKMDTHGRVGRVYHGLRRLTDDEIRETYRAAKIKLGSDVFASVDTLFSMPEACLYANVLAHFEAKHAAGTSVAPLDKPASPDPKRPLLGNLDSWKLFDDVRTAIDDIHRDGTLKNIIMADLPRYFVVDERLPLTLHKLRSAGKKLFLLTNSFWVYTQAVMSFLLDGRLKEYASWRQYFDVVLVGGKKPNFFTERKPFLEVNAVEGVEETVGELDSSAERFDRSKVYQGGNMVDFERLVACQGEEILYVGDHIFGDILRSKKDSRWRTCLIVEELETEIRGTLGAVEGLNALMQVDERRHDLDDRTGEQRALLFELDAYIARGDADADLVRRLEESAKRLRKEIDIAKRALRALDLEAQTLQDSLDKSFNPWWGRLLKANNELSRFGAQVELYADCYTSKVSNLLRYSPVHFFRAPREHMSHDAARARSQARLNGARRSA